MSSINYTTVTELPNTKITRNQLTRLYYRYKFASNYCKGKDILEVACGAGMGLGLLDKYANKVVGVDIDDNNLSFAKNTYKNRNKIEIIKLDAHNLEFPTEHFEVIILYEAIYYLKYPGKFLDECRRVLKKNGILIICTVNKCWHDFNPSEYSYQYFSVPELNKLLVEHDFENEFFGAFPDIKKNISEKLKSLIKRAAVKLNLIPKTMKGKLLLKKIFIGNMIDMPKEIFDDQESITPPIPISSIVPNELYTVFYSVSKKTNQN